MATTREQILLKAFGKRVATLRKSKGIRQQDLAKELNMHTVSIAYIESGQRWVTIGTLDKLAKKLGVKVKDLINF